jgi:hypothetical protein
MTDINKEAEENALEFSIDYKPFEENLNYREYAKYGFEKGFIAGANSKYVEAGKLKFAIEAVLEFRKATFGLGNPGLEKLQKQLKELENE